MCRIHPKEIFARHFASNHGAQAVQRADRGVPRRANGGEKTTEAGLLQKRRRGTAAAAAQAPGAEAHSAEDSENDDNLEPNQHAAARHQNKVQADLDGKLGDVGAAAELKRRLARAAGENARETRMSAVTGAADLGPHLTKAVCWVDIGAVSDDLSRALHARSCRSTENRADAAVYIVKDPNKPGRRVFWYALLKGALVVTGRAFTHPADVTCPVVKYLPATSLARTVYITEAFAAKHTTIANILRDTCRSWNFEVDFEAPGRPSASPAPGAPVEPHPAPRCPQLRNRPVAQAFVVKYETATKGKRSQMAILKRQDEVVEAQRRGTCVVSGSLGAPCRFL